MCSHDYLASMIITIVDLLNSGIQLVQPIFEAWGHIILLAISASILLYFLLDARVRAVFRL